MPHFSERMTAPEPEALRPKLQQAQATLRSALEEACAADLGDADTGELIKLEEVLAIANEAAKEAVSVRRRLKQARTRAGADVDTHAGNHREFEDAKGVRWMVFAVHPSSATKERAGLRAPFQDGWLAFDCGMETRRVAPIPDGWMEFAIDKLLTLCEQAEIAPRRTGKRPPG
jgi:hypothetical protein